MINTREPVRKAEVHDQRWLEPPVVDLSADYSKSALSLR